VPLHPQVEAVLAVLESYGEPPIHTSTPEAVRAVRKARPRPPTIELHEVRDVDAGGVPGRLYLPSVGRGGGLLVYLHGGGWTLGDLDSHDGVARGLALQSDQAVLSVDYRLAPEHPFPAGLEDAVAATHWAHAHAETLGCDPGRIGIGGDSAGGNLAAVVAQLQVAPLRFQLLVVPVTDARCGSATYAEHRNGPYLTAAGMHWFIGHYLSGEDGAPDDPRVSPLLGEDDALAAAPPALVITAELDPLRDEGEAYAARLRSLGVPTELIRYDGMFHAFLAFADAIDDGRDALARAGAAFRAQVESGEAPPTPAAAAARRRPAPAGGAA
jgi:acetyl esterase/lipase